MELLAEGPSSASAVSSVKEDEGVPWPKTAKSPF